MTAITYRLENGALFEFVDLQWTSTGRLFCQLRAFAPDQSILSNSKVELSSSDSRYRVSQELASHNGGQPGIWADALLSAWHSLDEQRRDSAERFTLENLSEEAEPSPFEFIWDPFIPAGFPSNVYGDGGASKSTTMMALSVAITQGLPFLGQPTMPGRIFYLDWELDKPTFLRRLYAICRGMGLSHPPAIWITPGLPNPWRTT